MMTFGKCPVCGGSMERRQVEKLLRGGKHTVSLRVNAEVCLHCGERLYAEETIRAFEAIRSKLEKQEFAHFKALGQSFTVEEDWPDKSVMPIS